MAPEIDNGRKIVDIKPGKSAIIHDGKNYNKLILLPHTTTIVETVCLLSRGKVDGYVNVDLDTDKIVSKSKTGTATYKEIKEYINDKYGFTVSSLNIAQVKDKCGLNKRNNYNKGKEGHKVPACPEKKEKAIKEAFAHFGLV